VSLSKPFFRWRPSFRVVMLSIMAFGLSSQSTHAHMAWLASDEDGKAVFWFGESLEDRTYHLPEKVAGIRLRGAEAAEPIAMEAVDRDDLVGLQSVGKVDGKGEVFGGIAYGLYHGMKLSYYVEHLPQRDATAWPTAPRDDAAIQSVITPSPGGGVTARILKDGESIPDVEVKLFDADGQESDAQTTDSAGMVTFESSVVKQGLNAVMVGINDPEATGDYQGETYQGVADYLTSTFFHGDPSPSTETSTESRRPSVNDNSNVSIISSGLPDLPEELTSFGAAMAGDSLYVYGGHTGEAHSYSVDEQSDRLWRLDLSADAPKWQQIATGPRLQGLALVAVGDKLIRVGGFSAMNEAGEDQDLRSQSSVAIFDQADRTWSSLPDLPEPRSSLDAAVLDDTLYVFGGWRLSGDSEQSRWHDTAWALDLSAAEPAWKSIAKPPFRRRALSVAAHAGRLFAIGGMQAVGGPTTRVDVYDPATDTWRQGPSLPGSGMSGFGSAAFACDGALFVSTMDGFVHRLNASRDDWETVAQSDPARFFHRLVPQADSLLVIGGANMEIGKFTRIERIVVR